jgi:hypothetical protein
MINQSQHKMITSSHPSPLGATKTNQPFIGSKYVYMTEVSHAILHHLLLISTLPFIFILPASGAFLGATSIYGNLEKNPLIGRSRDQ